MDTQRESIKSKYLSTRLVILFLTDDGPWHWISWACLLPFKISHEYFLKLQKQFTDTNNTIIHQLLKEIIHYISVYAAKLAYFLVFSNPVSLKNAWILLQQLMIFQKDHENFVKKILMAYLYQQFKSLLAISLPTEPTHIESKNEFVLKHLNAVSHKNS